MYGQNLISIKRPTDFCLNVQIHIRMDNLFGCICVCVCMCVHLLKLYLHNKTSLIEFYLSSVYLVRGPFKMPRDSCSKYFKELHDLALTCLYIYSGLLLMNESLTEYSQHSEVHSHRQLVDLPLTRLSTTH